jgi:hypothetical protein
MYRKLRRLRERLGASPNLMVPVSPSQKPRHMHWSTWDKLYEQERHVHAAILGAMHAAVKRVA